MNDIVTIEDLERQIRELKRNTLVLQEALSASYRLRMADRAEVNELSNELAILTGQDRSLTQTEFDIQCFVSDLNAPPDP